MLVIPFENHSHAPGLEWIGDSFPELLQERLTSPNLYVLAREDRLRAYDRLGIPAEVDLSRATIYRIAEQMDVDYVILGSYDFDGRTFTTTAQLLDMRREQLFPPMVEAGPLPQLIDVQTALAWDVLRTLRPDLSLSKAAYLESAPAIRLDAFENYVRGAIATSPDEQIRRFSEAVRLKPDYPEALLQLGKAYYRDRQYAEAVASLERVPSDSSQSREANFCLGLAAYSKGDYDRAESAFNFVASRLPLTEVYNNLGVVAARRGSKDAKQYFQKAIDADPNDADYHFNMAVSLYRSGDLAGASRQIRQTLTLRPNDSDAKSLLSRITSKVTANVHYLSSSDSSKLPLERIRTNYEESSFRQAAIKIAAVAEQRLAKTDPHSHAQFHADRGHELLVQGFLSEAEGQFREALSLDPANADSHAGLARVLEARKDFSGARSEAEAALRLREFPEPLLVLARLDLRENKTEAAAEDVNRALRWDPESSQALALQRAIAAKLAEKAQPLSKR